ncbi:MAG: hypothetical protein CME70_08700 [Halobacteriovorax sp.]|nr:hypothetical protein [Halobacteriovorax sp.]|tara:strand:- start:98246 stop:101896 length:3651 start_codon:yes stop_codon:yes gene_type:complete
MFKSIFNKFIALLFGAFLICVGYSANTNPYIAYFLPELEIRNIETSKITNSPSRDQLQTLAKDKKVKEAIEKASGIKLEKIIGLAGDSGTITYDSLETFKRLQELEGLNSKLSSSLTEIECDGSGAGKSNGFDKIEICHGEHPVKCANRNRDILDEAVKNIAQIDSSLSKKKSEVSRLNDSNIHDEFESLEELEEKLPKLDRKISFLEGSLQKGEKTLKALKEDYEKIKGLSEKRESVNRLFNKKIESLKCSLVNQLSQNEVTLSKIIEKRRQEAVNAESIEDRLAINSEIDLLRKLKTFESDGRTLEEIRNKVQAVANGEQREGVSRSSARLLNSILTSNIDCNQKDNEQTDQDQINDFLNEVEKLELTSKRRIKELELDNQIDKERLDELVFDKNKAEELFKKRKEDIANLKREIDSLNSNRRKNISDRDHAHHMLAEGCRKQYVCIEEDKSTSVDKGGESGYLYGDVINALRDRHGIYLEESEDTLKTINLYRYLNKVNEIRLSEIEDLSNEEIDWNEKNPGKYAESLLRTKYNTEEALRLIRLMKGYTDKEFKEAKRALEGVPAILELYKEDLYGKKEGEEGLFAKLDKIEKKLLEKDKALKSKYDEYVKWQVDLNLAQTDAYRAVIRSDNQFENSLNRFESVASGFGDDVLLSLSKGDMESARRALTNFRNVQGRQRQMMLSQITSTDRAASLKEREIYLEAEYQKLEKRFKQHLEATGNNDKPLSSDRFDYITDGGGNFHFPGSSHQGSSVNVWVNDGVDNHRAPAGMRIPQDIQRQQVTITNTDANGNTTSYELTVVSTDEGQSQIVVARNLSPDCKQNCTTLRDLNGNELGPAGTPIEFTLPYDEFRGEASDYLGDLVQDSFNTPNSGLGTNYQDDLRALNQRANERNIPSVAETSGIILRQTESREAQVREQTSNARTQSSATRVRSAEVLSSIDSSLPPSNLPDNPNREEMGSTLAIAMTDMGLSTLPIIGNGYNLVDFLAQVFTNHSLLGLPSDDIDKLITGLAIILPNLKWGKQFKHGKKMVQSLIDLLKKHGKEGFDFFKSALLKGGGKAIGILRAVGEYPKVALGLSIKEIKVFDKIVGSAKTFFGNTSSVSIKDFSLTARSILGNNVGAAGKIENMLKSTTELAKSLKFTSTTARHMENTSRHVPINTLSTAIMYGKRTIDPQGAANTFKYTIEMFKNGKKYNLEVVLRETDNTILHFLYR